MSEASQKTNNQICMQFESCNTLLNSLSLQPHIVILGVINFEQMVMLLDYHLCGSTSSFSNGI